MTDMLGNELKVGDTIVVNVPHITGKIAAIAGDSGLVQTGQPSMPMAVVKVEMQFVIGSPNGQLEVIKVSIPEPKKASE